MVDVHLYPAKISDAAAQLRADTLVQWTNQLKSYDDARQLVQDGVNSGMPWVGGPGKSGQVQQSGKALLQVLLRELDRLIQEKTDFQNSFTAYLDCLAGLASSLQSADKAAADNLHGILKKLDGGN